MEQTERISRSALFMRIAYDYSLRSTCDRGHVGCVIVRDKDLVVGGYNGAPPGQPHCLDVGCDLELGDELGCQRTTHAEANAICHAAKLGIALDGCVAFCTHSPCKNCGMLLISAGVKMLVYNSKYRATPWLELADSGLRLVAVGDTYGE